MGLEFLIMAYMGVRQGHNSASPSIDNLSLDALFIERKRDFAFKKFWVGRGGGAIILCYCIALPKNLSRKLFAMCEVFLI